MVLGQVLSRLGDETLAAETLISLGDLPLMVDVERTAFHFGQTAPMYAVDATRRFAAHAGDEDWLALMAALERAEDPGGACLRQMLQWSLRADAAPVVGEEHAGIRGAHGAPG